MSKAAINIHVQVFVVDMFSVLLVMYLGTELLCPLVTVLTFWGTTKLLSLTSFFDIPVVPAPFVELSLFLGSHSFPTVSQCGIWKPMSWPCLSPWPHFPYHTVTGNSMIPKDLKFWTSSYFWLPCFYLRCSLLPEMPTFHLSLNELLRSSEQPESLLWKFYWTQIPLTFLLLPSS